MPGTGNSKGYLLSFSVLVLFSLLIVFSQFYFNSEKSFDETIAGQSIIDKAGFVADDISSDLNSMLGTGIEADRNTEFIQLKFFDVLPSDLNKQEALLNYSDFINSSYALQQNAFLSLDLNDLADGKTELVFSNGLEYDYNYSPNSSYSDAVVSFYSSTGSTNVLSYDINVSVNSSSIKVIPWTWNAGGDISVNLYYYDLNSSNTVWVSGKIDSALDNSYKIYFSASPDDVLEIHLGLIDGRQKSFKLLEDIDTPSSKASLYLGALIPFVSNNDFSYYYNGTINYRQLDVNNFSFIELGKG
ncbi:MAG: hypothetical protein AB1467_05310 [Candidatus Diapherotrites archaeon]